MNANRHITGTLRGYDPFMNLVLEEAVEELSASERNSLGVVVIRGNSIDSMEPLEAL
jgi:small nuclear ribonucleoprotein G